MYEIKKLKKKPGRVLLDKKTIKVERVATFTHNWIMFMFKEKWSMQADRMNVLLLYFFLHWHIYVVNKSKIQLICENILFCKERFLIRTQRSL